MKKEQEIPLIKASEVEEINITDDPTVPFKQATKKSPRSNIIELSNDDFTQAGDLFRIMPKDEQNRLMDTIAGAMAGVPSSITDRQIEDFMKADVEYGVGIANRLDKS